MSVIDLQKRRDVEHQRKVLHLLKALANTPVIGTDTSRLITRIKELTESIRLLTNG